MKGATSQSSPFKVTQSNPLAIMIPSFLTLSRHSRPSLPSTDVYNRLSAVWCTGIITPLAEACLSFTLACYSMRAQTKAGGSDGPRNRHFDQDSGEDAPSAVGGASKLVQVRNNWNATISQES